MKFGLDERTLGVIIEVLKKYEKIEKAVIYGSRANGTYRNGSDIDLTFYGDLTYRDLLEIENELDDLMLPFMFDLSIYDMLTNENFIEHIDRVGKVLYQK